MNRQILLRALAKVARDEGLKAARYLSGKLWQEAQRRAIAKGLVDGEVSPKDALERLKGLYRDGKLNKEEFQRLSEDVKVFFRRDPKS